MLTQTLSAVLNYIPYQPMYIGGSGTGNYIGKIANIAITLGSIEKYSSFTYRDLESSIHKAVSTTVMNYSDYVLLGDQLSSISVEDNTGLIDRCNGSPWNTQYDSNYSQKSPLGVWSTGADLPFAGYSCITFMAKK